MLDGRIYRTGLVVVALALLVLGFSFENPSPPLSSPLAPDAYNGQNVATLMGQLARSYPRRPPGSPADRAMAGSVASAFRTSGFTRSVTTDTFDAQTADGPRTLEDVVAVRPGIQSGSVVVVAARDARGSPAAAAASGTATELELARDLAGETLHHTMVLVSTSGSQGLSGAIHLASTLAGPVDAVIVLGDVGSAHLRQPLVLPWSSGQSVAPPVLRETVAGQLSQQANLTAAGSSLLGQFLHLAFPFTVSSQGPFDAHGIPAVTVSVSGEHGPGPSAPVADSTQLDLLGRAILATVTAVDAGPTLPAPAPYVLLSGKVIPGWAISLFVLALIIPVVLTTIDGLARARRHGHVIWRWMVVVLACAVPFLLAAAFVLAARLVGALPVAPPGPVPPGAVPITTGAVVVLILAGVITVASFALLRPVLLRFARGRRSRRPPVGEHHEGLVAAILITLCVAVLAIWLTNPFAALLAVPALHLWLAVLSPDLRLRLPIRAALLALGLVPLVLVAAYYAGSLGYGPIELLWTATLLVVGHGVSLLAVLEWTLVLTCGGVTAGLLLASTRQPRPEPVPVTVRGPLTYAGPGSLGGTESALRR